MDRAIIEHDLKMAFDDGYQAGYEAAQPKWISVEEQLPEHGAMAIAHTLYFYEVLQWDKKCELWFSAHSVHSKDFVTHWMPLPEPPMEEV